VPDKRVPETEQLISCGHIGCGVTEPIMYGCDKTCEFYCAEHFEKLGCADQHPEDCMTKVFPMEESEVGSSRKINPEDERPEQSEEFLISRGALDEAHSALCGAREALGDIANISRAIELLKTAQGNLGDTYNGH
jgi:hypothetical protein